MSSFGRGNRQLEEKDTQVLGISCDSHHSQRMCANSMGGVAYPVLGDFHPHGKVAQAYGIFNEERGTALRSMFIIDKEGIIRFVRLYEQGTLPSPEEAMEELAKLGL